MKEKYNCIRDAKTTFYPSLDQEKAPVIIMNKGIYDVTVRILFSLS